MVLRKDQRIFYALMHKQTFYFRIQIVRQIGGKHSNAGACEYIAQIVFVVIHPEITCNIRY